MLKGRPTAVAVVELEKVFNSLHERDAIEAELHGKVDAMQTDQKKKEEEISHQRDNLGVMSPANPGYAAEQEKLEQKALFELRGWEEWQQNGARPRARGCSWIQLYNKILDAIARVAKDNGYDVVLYKESAPDFNKAKNDELSTIMRSRKVLYAA